MRRSAGLILGVAALGAGAASAATPVELEVDTEVVFVAAPWTDDSEDQATEVLLSEWSLNGQAETVFDNGVRLRARSSLRLQKDHPARPGGLGGFGSDPLALTGAFSGLSGAPAFDQDDVIGRFETAYLQLDGGYGELRLGRDQGVAARFHEGANQGFSHARLDSALLDPTGLSIVRTRHDLTAPSLKLSYATPRLLGLRAGASFTPEATAEGLDRRPAAGTGLITPDQHNSVEFALNGSRRLRETGLRIEGALAWSRADLEHGASTAIYEEVETRSAGLSLTWEDWTVGGSWLGSDNGLSNADYTAWSAGASRKFGDWVIHATYGEAQDDGAGLDGRSWRVGAGRKLDRGSRLSLAYIEDEVDQIGQRRSSTGIVVEITLSAEILNITGN